GHLQLFPRIFAEGTRDKPYQTLTVDTTDLTTGSLPMPDTSYRMNRYDELRVNKKKNLSWRYLVDREQLKGPVHVTFRGKSLAFTVGPHILVIHFGLEGYLHILSKGDYEEIISECRPGPNSNRAKADRLRTFPLPSRFITPGSSDVERTINILAAIVMEDAAIIISDFSRLTRLHVISSSRFFTAKDLEVNSELWTTRLWSAFPGGSDWMKEPEEALLFMDRWRSLVLHDDTPTPIIDCFLDADGPAAGVGAHLANDILFLLALHPDTPAVCICADEALYREVEKKLSTPYPNFESRSPLGHMRDFFPLYMAQWISDEFKKRCGGTANSHNSLDFNYTSDTNFISSRVRVFRRLEARVDRELFDRYQSLGLLDANHTIGEPYNKPWTPLPVSFRTVRVLHDGKKRYHIIQARKPASWRQSTGAFDDIAKSGYQTTVGVASFREVLSNKVNLDQQLENRKPGRPPKLRTGKVGRPRSVLTQKKIDKMKLSVKKHFRTVSVAVTPVDEPGNEENADDVEMSTSLLSTLGRVTRSQAKMKRDLFK
ncbi:hypothetical protein GGX14DRAFT_372584, partial [Mycena pura]